VSHTPEFTDATGGIFGCRILRSLKGAGFDFALESIAPNSTSYDQLHPPADLRGLVPAHTKLFCPLNLYH
jgi:hypothetical protein